jgi:aryl-alcohol dehydrogenase-like predicted oxidoreductase
LKTLQKGDAIAELVKAREAGKIRFAGYSGDNEAAAYAADHPEIAVIETSINIADQINIDRVLPLAKKNRIGILAKRPIANAAWKLPEQQPGMYRSYAKAYTDRLAAMKLDPTELGFSGSPERAFPELALRFTLSQDADIVAIIGTTSPANAAANLEYAKKGPLPAETVRKIREAFHRADPEGKWTGQT